MTSVPADLESKEFWRDRIRRNFVEAERPLVIAARESVQFEVLSEHFPKAIRFEVDPSNPLETLDRLRAVSCDFDFVFLRVEADLMKWLEGVSSKISVNGRLWAQFPRTTWEEMFLTNHERSNPNFDKLIETVRADRFFQSVGMRDVAVGTEGMVFGDWHDIKLPVSDGSRLELFSYRTERKPLLQNVFEQVLSLVDRATFSPPRTVPQFLRRAKEMHRKSPFRQPIDGEVLLNKSPSTYPYYRISAYGRWASRHPDFLPKLVERICKNTTDDTDRMFRIYQFVQDAVVRDPIAQPLYRDGSLPGPAITLLAQSGRCGHVANLLVELLNIAGIRSKVWQLPQHVSVKVSLSGNEWFLLDPDIFKFGVKPLIDGKFITVAQICERPEVLDRLPATGWFQDDLFPRRRSVRGYHEDLTIVERGYTSNYFRHAPSELKVRPSAFVNRVSGERDDNKVRLFWNDIADRSSGFLYYEIRVSSVSRGWSYLNFRQEKIPPVRGRGDILIVRSEKSQIEFEVPSHVAAFVEVAPITNWIAQEKETYFWPSEELSLKA